MFSKTICPDIIGKVENEKPSIILHSILLSYLFLNQCQKIKHMSKPRQSTHALLSLNWILVFRYEPAKMDIYPRWSLIVYIFFANYIRISKISSVLIFLLLFCIPKTCIDLDQCLRKVGSFRKPQSLFGTKVNTVWI